MVIETKCVTFVSVNSQLPIALHILGYLTACGGESATSEAMAKSYGTSPVVLRRVLTKLQRAGLVETRRGAKGGCVLARDAHTMTLRHAYEALDAEPHLLARNPGSGGRIEGVLAEFMNDVMGEAESALLAQLEAVTIADMDRRVRSALSAHALSSLRH